MPCGYLHRRCAEQACEASRITPVENDVFVLGAMGPDPLFLLGMYPPRLSSKPQPYAHALHRTRTGAFLCALLGRAKESGAVERAFAMGFLTHYALDSTVHPYVYAHSVDAQGHYSSLLHVRLESWWDTLYYHREGHTGAPFPLPGVTETKQHWERIAAFWSLAVNDVYPELSLTPALIFKALQDAEHVCRLKHSPRGGKFALVWVLERLIGKPLLMTAQMSAPFVPSGDIENTSRRPWNPPADPETERNEGLTELFAAAIQRAAQLLGAAGRYFDDEIDDGALALAIGNVGYDTGKTSLP